MEQLSTILPAEAPAKINPFKGAYSYGKDDRDSFYGRDGDLNEVVKNIEQYTLSLLYSSSGVGKSSLLKAGLIPILDKISKFVPIYIRISDSMITDKVRSFSEAVIELIKEVAKEKSIRIEFDESLPPIKTITRFLFFSKFTVKDEVRHRQHSVIPVLIFDQFEELFSLRFKKADPGDLLNDLRNIIEGLIPDDVLQLLNVQDNPENQEELLYLKDELQSTNKWYRVLFSFREEYLPSFDSLKNIIPSVFNTKGRYHLEAFSIEMASEVIQNISESKISASTAYHLAKMMSISEGRTNRFREEVQPFMLSLICYSLYPRIAGEKQDETTIRAIDEEDKDLIQSEMLKYVENVFEHYSPAARKFIEEELITDDGKRTMKALSDKEITEEICNDLTQLAENERFRFLNVIVYYGSKHIEILHDKFLQPLLDSRRARREREIADQVTRIKMSERRKSNKKLFISSGVFFIIIMSCLYYYFFIEKAKVAAYNRFFQDQNRKAIGRLRASDGYNSIASLASILTYEESVSQLPVYKNKSSAFFRDFNDSVSDVFKNRALVFTQYADDESIFSTSGNFRFSVRNMYDSSMLLKIYRLSTSGYRLDDSILIKKNASDSIQYSLHDFFIKIDDFKTSVNDSLLAVVYHNQASFYNLFEKKGLKYKQAFYSIKNAKRVYFSVDNRFVLSRDNANKNSDKRIYKIIGQPNKKTTIEPLTFDPDLYLPCNEEFLLSGSYFLYSEDRELMRKLKSLFLVDAVRTYYKPPLCYKIFQDKKKHKLKFVSYNFQTDQVTTELFDSITNDQPNIEYIQKSKKTIVIHPNGLIYRYDYPYLILTDAVDSKILSNDSLPIIKSFVLDPDLLLLLFTNKFSLIDLGAKKEIASYDHVTNIRDVVDAFCAPSKKTICIVRENGIASFWHYDLKTDTYDNLKNSYKKLQELYSDSLINANKRGVRASSSLR
ncbi:MULTISPECIES: nSTAND1 domain-containing NTPase [Niastella]|uniref:Novel STAND NTPase 1 domain-containing protein n=1 Tax=Niastella soli TaxID=2821487 RepID=A0ABS3Z009_9BACT|nr:hypothetical protein [Niastella soli]MBO9203509.1 hypothetical protein [Niastella soli]